MKNVDQYRDRRLRLSNLTTERAFISVTAVWAAREEFNNYSQKHDAEIIKEEKRIEVENEVRLQVDELMREELKNLKMVRSTNLPVSV